jgi:hypothetical protein
MEHTPTTTHNSMCSILCLWSKRSPKNKWIHLYKPVHPVRLTHQLWRQCHHHNVLLVMEKSSPRPLVNILRENQLDELMDATICPGTLIVLIRKTSNIASLLGCTPRLQAAKKLKLIESDLADLQTLSRVVPSYVSVVIHSAAEGGDWGPRQVFVNSNEVGTANLVDVVTKKCTNLRRFVHVSSVDVYPHNVKPSLCFEDVPIVDHSNYGYTHTKAAAERIVMQQLNSCEWTILRPAVVYGPGSTIAANIGYLSRLLFVNRFIFLGLRRSKNIIKRIWFIDRGILLRQRRSVC